MAKIFNKKQSFKIDLPDGSKIVKIKLSDEEMQELDKRGIGLKFPYSYFKKYLRETDVNKLENNLKEVFFKKLPHETICQGCPLFNNEGAKIPDEKRNCFQAWLEYQMLYFIAGNNLVSLIEANKKVLRKIVKQKLVELFYTKAFEFENANSFFKVGEMVKFILRKGLKEISNQLKQMEIKTALEVASKHFHTIKENILLTELGEPGFEDFQKAEERFWENKEQELEKKNKHTSNKPDEPVFIPNNEDLSDWILPDFIPKFLEIEKELFRRGYIKNSYQWQKHKTVLIKFLCVIINYKYFRQIVKGKKIQDFHKRQFISERYGFGKTGLTETSKKHKPTLEFALIPFSWIKKPD